MKENFEKCLEMLLHHEGGYVNHPKDPGGETNLGVTKRVYEEWGGTKDMKALTIEDVAPIYKKNIGIWLRGITSLAVWIGVRLIGLLTAELVGQLKQFKKL